MRSYVIDRALYQQTIWLIRRYPDLKERYDDALKVGSGLAGGAHSNAPNSVVENAAIKRATLSAQILAIEKALGMIPEAYRAGIINYITMRTPYPHYAAINTWKMWKQRFVFYVALFVGWL